MQGQAQDASVSAPIRALAVTARRCHDTDSHARPSLGTPAGENHPHR